MPMTRSAVTGQRIEEKGASDPRAAQTSPMLYWVASNEARSVMDSEAHDPMRDFLREHNIHEVECVIADMTGIARGKILPKDLFLTGEHMRLPKSVLLNTVHGEQPNNTPYVGPIDPDMV
jgi:hypothetical protein